MLKKVAAMLLIFTGMAIWVGCVSTTNRYLYAAVPNASQIVAYREDPNSGILTALSVSPITAGPAVEAIAIHPSKKYLYAANAGAGNVSTFTIDSTGALTEGALRTDVDTTPTLMLMDPSGGFLYVANAGSRDISEFSIDPGSGALTPLSGSPFQIGTSALNMKLSPSGNVLYVSGSGTPGFIEVCSLSAGAIQGVVQIASAGDNPDGLAIDPSGAFLYVANSAPDNTISIFTISSVDGSLTPLTTVGGSNLTAPTSLLIDSSGKYLYAGNTGSSNITGFAIAADGSLTLLTANSVVSTNSAPSFMVSDPSGKFIFVGNQTTPSIQSFKLDASSGTLTSVASYSVGNAPTSIVVSP